MGEIVAFSEFESRREKQPLLSSIGKTGSVFMFTGIRYERIIGLGAKPDDENGYKEIRGLKRLSAAQKKLT